MIDDSTVGVAAWSSKNIVDKLCPSFKEKDTLVQCEPVEGYPLEVTAAGAGGFTVTACGKNLYNKVTYPANNTGYVDRGSGEFSTSSNYLRTGYIPVHHLVGQYITFNYAPTSASRPGMAFYKSDKTFISGGAGENIEVPSGAMYMIFSVAVGNKNENLQIEIGSEATDYEQYCSSTAAGADGKAVVTAVKGMNNVFAYSGDNAVEITVVGRADPVAVIEKLTNAVNSLGGNI